jgi:hypothetical protein
VLATRATAATGQLARQQQPVSPDAVPQQHAVWQCSQAGGPTMGLRMAVAARNPGPVSTSRSRHGDHCHGR